MADIIKFQSPVDKRIEEIDKEIDAIGEETEAMLSRECLKVQNGVKIPYLKRAETTEKVMQAMREILLLSKEGDELLGNKTDIT